MFRWSKGLFKPNIQKYTPNKDPFQYSATAVSFASAFLSIQPPSSLNDFSGWLGAPHYLESQLSVWIQGRVGNNIKIKSMSILSLIKWQLS